MCIKSQKTLPGRATRARKKRARARSLARRARSHARSQLLLVGVTLDGERDEAIDQRGIRETACGPHLRVHADRREAGNGVYHVEVERAAVAREEEIDA